MKRLLIVAHSPSPNTQALRDAVVEGVQHSDIEAVECVVKSPFDASADDVDTCDAIVLGTPENLGYMSGALKDFFDRCYYAVSEDKRGLPCALYVRAGLDGTGTRRGVESICKGLGWRFAQEPLVLKGEWQEAFKEQARELGLYMAAGLDNGLF
ncbi:flavodoxin family protein [Vreelandella sp. EE22]